jgi:hypothetical protein
VSVLPDDWRLAWVVLSDGRVGTVSRESVAAVTDVAWLPAGPTQTVDVMALYRDYGDRMSMAVYLEVELVGSRGQSAWHCIATHRRFHRVERTVPPVWSGLQLPAALKGRLRLYGSDEPDFANAEAHEIPLPRR